jgi:hypothetical protein
VTILSPPDQGRRAGSPTLYPQPYDYTGAATGLEKVPIPIWATRSFTASWAAPLPKKPPIKAALRLPRAGAGERLPLGEITNNLPVSLQSVALFYGDSWYNLGTLEPGETRSVGELFTGGPKAKRGEWLKDDGALRPKDPLPVQGRRAEDAIVRQEMEQVASLRPLNLLIKQALFHGESDRTTWANSGMHTLDQSWRLWKETTNQQRDEVILVARSGPLRGSAEELIAKGLTPTTLWLDRLPGTVPQRPKLAAVLTQETYLRVYIPVTRGE